MCSQRREGAGSCVGALVVADLGGAVTMLGHKVTVQRRVEDNPDQDLVDLSVSVADVGLQVARIRNPVTGVGSQIAHLSGLVRLTPVTVGVHIVTHQPWNLPESLPRTEESGSARSAMTVGQTGLGE